MAQNGCVVVIAQRLSSKFRFLFAIDEPLRQRTTRESATSEVPKLSEEGLAAHGQHSPGPTVEDLNACENGRGSESWGEMVDRTPKHCIILN